MSVEQDRLRIEYRPGAPGARPRGPLARALGWVVGGALLGLALMFSLIAFVLVCTAGLIFAGYVMWKTRALRRRMREHPPGGNVIEGEVVRETDREPPR